MSFTRQQIADICRKFGTPLNGLPDGVLGPQLLWAISGNESSFGANTTPRHEPAFDIGGVYGEGPVMKPLLAQFGRKAAASYGPWQIMFCNASKNATPDGFNDLESAAEWTVPFLQRQVLHFQPDSLAEIGEIWNGGHPMLVPPLAVAAYVRNLIQNYTVPMPEVSK